MCSPTGLGTAVKYARLGLQANLAKVMIAVVGSLLAWVVEVGVKKLPREHIWAEFAAWSCRTHGPRQQTPTNPAASEICGSAGEERRGPDSQVRIA